MKMKLGDVLYWFCEQCGHHWPVPEEQAAPAPGARCRDRSWQESRGDDAEL